MKYEDADLLQAKQIPPTAQRLAVASYVLHTEDHPTADLVFQVAKARCPKVSRATVYNTLNLFLKKGLLKQLTLTDGKVVFDPFVGPHHHFIDEATGAIYDIPWRALSVGRVDVLEGFEVHEFSVVLKGKRRRR
jgi:Fur family iron response transcriptional regulator